MFGSKEQKKVVIVTGASGGIGKAISLELAKLNFNVIVNYRGHNVDRVDDAREVVTEIEKSGSEGLCFDADVTERDQVRLLIKESIDRFGRIDGLVINAGVLEQKDFFRITDYELQNVLNNNFKSAFICTQEISELLEDGGSIVNIASMGGQIGGPNAPHYSASKGALITFTKSTARLLASRKIRVNAVSPGFIETDMFSHILKKQGKSRKDIIDTIPLNRIGMPSDVADAVGFLLGDKSSYITGQILNVNGGSLI